jgi:hypothetical protein
LAVWAEDSHDRAPCQTVAAISRSIWRREAAMSSSVTRSPIWAQDRRSSML